jgi:carboxyl-terminal processing protease
MTTLFHAIRLPLLILALVFSAPVAAESRTVPESELQPSPLHVRTAEIILHIVDSYHYRKRALDDQLSNDMFDNYLSSLDGNRSFFLRSDILEFERYRYTLDDALQRPDLSPAFEIFLRYRQRISERVDYALELLGKEFDFTIDEDYRFDRREADWPADAAEMRELWRKRVKNDFLNLRIAGRSDDEIRDLLGKRYQRLRTSTNQINAGDVFQSFMNAYTRAIEPHTAYFSPRTSENFDISMRLSLEGIGAVLRADTDYTQVQRIIPGGPADLSGQLKEEDRIVGVGQEKSGEIVDVIGWRLDDVVDLIRGPKGSIVRLEVLPAGLGPEGPNRVIELVRDEIKLEEQAAQSNVIELESGARMGVLKIPTFYSDFAAQARGDRDYRSTTRDVRRLLADFRHEEIEGLVVDLRGNGGGSLAEALELTGLFIESGPIVQTRDASGRIDVNRDPNPGIEYGGPLAVLVDRNSASASEIFAGAIQDYRRGVIIGEPTFGKGTVQNIVDLNRFVRRSDQDHGRLKTTIAQFYRISGGSNQHKGVVPDILFPIAEAASEHGERALENALPWDRIEAARFVPASAPTESFTDARQRHEKRVRDDRLFQLLMKEIALVREANERKTVSLHEQKRKQERDALLTARRQMRNEFRLAQGLPPLADNDEIEQPDIEPQVANVAEIAELGEEADDMEQDILLKEAARILFDLIVPAHRTAATIPAAETPM